MAHLQWFKDLGALAATGNFSRAAEMNNISQSALSRRIKSLEDWVGAVLVDRTRHPIGLTDAGRQMLEAGEQALNRIETERDQIRENLAQPDRYVITFAAQHSIGWRFYPSWLQAFEAAFGPIMSRLRADNLPTCVADLRREEVDFVIAYESDHASGIEPGPEFQSLVIGRDRLIPVSKAAANGDPLFRVDDPSLAAIPFLRFGPSAPIGQHLEPILAASNLGERLKPVYENAMVGALRIRARDGLGLAWLPQSLIQPDLDAGLLTLAGGEELAIDLRIRLYRLARNHNKLIRKVWTFLSLREGVLLV